MENYILRIYYYKDNDYQNHSKATEKEKVASHYDNLNKLFNSNQIRTFNTKTKEMFMFSLQELKKHRLLNFKELISLKKKTS